jgi:hypothetical protein
MFDDHMNYRHRTVVTHTLHMEPEFFDVHEYRDYLVVVDDIDRISLISSRPLAVSFPPVFRE